MEGIDENPWGDEFKPLRLSKQRPARSNSHGEEFKMRPIRLTSKTTESNPNQRRSLDHDNRDVTPKTSSELKTSPKTPRRRSIQIKNLPIIEKSPPKKRIESNSKDFIFAICLVDFHHIRGPEIQWWKSNYLPEIDHGLFKNLPFQSLPDGSHLFEETFSNFNLIYNFETNKSYDNLNDLNNFNDDPRDLKTLFGCSCIRQININELSEEELKRNKDIKRSIVQKALVIINKDKPIFTKIKDKLSIITRSYFLQDNLSNFEVFENLFENLNHEINFNDNEEFFINLNLKQTLLKLGSKFLVIFKALLSEKKILIYSNNKLELLTKFQNNLISLIPNLINNLIYSGCQLSDYQEIFNGKLVKPTSLNTENRDSMLAFFGLPLKIFNTKGSFWNPYLPLQQINQLNFPETKSFMIGCSNLLFVNQLQQLGIDLLINLDTYEVSSPNGLNNELSLSSYDKHFMTNLIANCSQDKIVDDDHENYIGNDDYIRYQFEDYLLSMLSTVKFHQYLQKFGQYPPGFTNSSNPNANEDNNVYNGDLSTFGSTFLHHWQSTENFKIWDLTCDEFIFNFINPRHVQVDVNNESTISSFFNNLNLKFKTFNVESESDNESKPNKFINKKFNHEDFEVVDNNDSPPHESSSKRDKDDKKEKKWGFFKK